MIPLISMERCPSPTVSLELPNVLFELHKLHWREQVQLEHQKAGFVGLWSRWAVAQRLPMSVYYKQI